MTSPLRRNTDRFQPNLDIPKLHNRDFDITDQDSEIPRGSGAYGTIKSFSRDTYYSISIILLTFPFSADVSHLSCYNTFYLISTAVRGSPARRTPHYRELEVTSAVAPKKIKTGHQKPSD
ncbi:hypothetical protein M404DRAFT_995781 [Pisolithus tinctorius Marx 270]|uniref:Uncharacterized protein n=1 Tax=Pisolithus tinctorius Marx 270 TaxID=870435 RepID=A0A0C3PQ13_PISTI|nr:hypothetical protein M404DRAFT_995781 [Pisolithus tinctorius Marx 270]